MVSAYEKPKGFWITDDSDCCWKSWCEGEDFNTGGLKFCHEVVMDESSILFIHTVDELDKFTRQYSVASVLQALLSRSAPAINWPVVAKKYKGIIITPYLHTRRMSHESSWYYGWDCASGCIWDVSAITDIRPREVVSTGEQDACTELQDG